MSYCAEVKVIRTRHGEYNGKPYHNLYALDQNDPLKGVLKFKYDPANMPSDFVPNTCYTITFEVSPFVPEHGKSDCKFILKGAVER